MVKFGDFLMGLMGDRIGIGYGWERGYGFNLMFDWSKKGVAMDLGCEWNQMVYCLFLSLLGGFGIGIENVRYILRGGFEVDGEE